MNINIIERDRENGHFDVYVDNKRTHKIRGGIGNLVIQHEGKFDFQVFNFKTVDACLMHIFTRLLYDI